MCVCVCVCVREREREIEENDFLKVEREKDISSRLVLV